tara:strand:- start:24639 stop:24947 length:309 start_codon:yes stop_codon:yes gene_type:complete
MTVDSDQEQIDRLVVGLKKIGFVFKESAPYLAYQSGKYVASVYTFPHTCPSVVITNRTTGVQVEALSGALTSATRKEDRVPTIIRLINRETKRARPSLRDFL